MSASAVVGGALPDGSGFWVDFSNYDLRPDTVAFVTMVGHPDDEWEPEQEWNVCYLAHCPFCGSRYSPHQFNVRPDEWTGRTSKQGYLRGAVRECDYTGEPMGLIVTKHRLHRYRR